MSALMALSPVATYTGSAGSIKANTTLTEGINFTNWYYTDDIGESFTDGKIIFGENSNRLSRIVSNKKVNNMKDAGKTEWMSADLNLKITTAPEEKRFGLAFALDNPSARICSANSCFLYFTMAEDGLKLGLSKFDNQGAESSLFITENAVAQTGEEVNLKLNVAVDGKVAIELNGVDLGVSSEVVVNADGYVGLGQDAKFGVEVSKLEVIAYENVTPLNSDIYETFDGDNYNANLLYSRGVTGYNKPSYAKVENGKFLFLNAGTSATTKFNVEDNSSGQKVINTYYYKQTSYISTRYAYSNVDLSFDLQFVGNGAEDTSGFSIILGRDSYGESSSELKLEAEKLAKGIKKDLFEVRFTKSNKSKIIPEVQSFIELYNGEKFVEKVPLADENNIFSNALYGKTVSVWLQMINGDLSVWLKVEGKASFNKVYQANTGDTPSGCVQIRANGSSAKDVFSTLGNMTVDNISVTNFDMDAKKQTVAFRTNIWDTSDFEYKDTWDDSDIFGGN